MYLGYKGVGLTVDHGVLSPLDPDWRREAERVRGLLERHQQHSVIETGARFLLDPRRKHQPTLLSPSADERKVRLDFLGRCAELARLLGADAVSFWSGSAVDDAEPEILWQRLTAGCHRLLEIADGVPLAFEPEPGMFVDTMTRFEELGRRMGTDDLGLALDIGHLHCQGETPIADRIRQWAEPLRVVHIDDMRTGVHDHLMFGDGEIDFPPVLAALDEVGYWGGVFVELSRHSHDAVRTAQCSFDFLRDPSRNR
ncbi:MAG TPA: sugar phosphate isomerase/epimerase family protein [Gemmataceae bacterium]|nr:sugar phosphate isomerase/epimerase family protein [Gemmataceae bacterium]